MKKSFAILLFITALAFTAAAQSPGNVRYRDIRGSYDPRDYVYDFYDKYDPTWCGLASFFIPGLGQCICDEWGRGLGIVAANAGFTLLEITEASVMFYSAAAGSAYYRDSRASAVFDGRGSAFDGRGSAFDGRSSAFDGRSSAFDGRGSAFFNALMVSSAGAALLTLAGQAAFNIWNICDAVNVAKVKDLFYRDSALASSSRLDMSFAPTLAVVPGADGSACPAPGIGVRVTF